jgi:uncharacterized protein
MTPHAPGRILLLDSLRGYAVLGMLWVNLAIFALPYAANALPTLLGGTDPLDLGLWTGTRVFMEGAIRTVFCMLFGAAALIYLDEARLAREGVARVDHFYRRNLILALFGLLHAWLLLWPHDVLYAYGLIGLLLFPLRRVPALALLLLGIGLQALAPLEIDWQAVTDWLAGAPGTPLTPSGAPAGAADPAETARFLDWLRAQAGQDIHTYRSGYLAIFAAQAADTAAQESTYFFRRHLFEIGGEMLVGMALYRWGVLAGRWPGRRYALLALLGFGLGGWLRGADLYQVYAQGFDPLTMARFTEGDLDLGRLPVALGHIGLIGAICRWGRAPRLVAGLAATGRMALTHYIGQTVIGVTLFYGCGLGLFGRLDRWQLALIFVAVVAVQVGSSVLWLKHLRYGPLEWLWRSLTLGHTLPLRRAAPQSRRPEPDPGRISTGTGMSASIVAVPGLRNPVTGSTEGLTEQP